MADKLDKKIMTAAGVGWFLGKALGILIGSTISTYIGLVMLQWLDWLPL